MNKFYKSMGVVLFLSLSIYPAQAFLFKKACRPLSSAALCRLATDSNPLEKTRVLPKDKPFLQKACSMEDQYFKGVPVGNKCECSYDIASTKWFEQLRIGEHEPENTLFTIISTTQMADLECPILSFSEVKALAFGPRTSLDIKDRGSWKVKRGTWKHKHWASVKGSKKPARSPNRVKAHMALRHDFCTYYVPVGPSGSWKGEEQYRPIKVGSLESKRYRPVTVLETTKSLVPNSIPRENDNEPEESEES